MKARDPERTARLYSLAAGWLAAVACVASVVLAVLAVVSP